MFERRTKIRKGKVKHKRIFHGERVEDIHAQSPIALFSPQTKVHLKKPLKFAEHWSADGDALLLNNGYTAYLTFVNRNRPPTLSGGPLLQDYTFEQLHFHWGPDNGSEHCVDGTRFSAEAHLVYFNNKYGCFDNAVMKKDGLAVVGFLLRICDDENPSFGPISSAVVDIEMNLQETKLKADCLRWMQNRNIGEYFTYKGSLTTEPFHESVTWIVYKDPVDVSIEQIAPFRRMQIYRGCERIDCNARDLQQAPEGHRVHLIRSSRLKSETSREGAYGKMIYDRMITL